MRRCNRQLPDTLLLRRRNPWPPAAFHLFDTRIPSPLFVHRHSLPAIQTWPSHHQTVRPQAAFHLFDTQTLLPLFVHRHSLPAIQMWPSRHQIARLQAAFCLFDTQTLSPLSVHRHSLPAIQTWPSRHQIARRRAVSCLFDTRIPSPFSLRQHNLSTLQTRILRYHTLPRPEALSPPHIRFQTVPPCLRSPCIRPNRRTQRRLSHTARPLPPVSPTDSGTPEWLPPPQDSLSMTKACPAPSDTRSDSFHPAHTHIPRLSSEPHCRCTRAVQAPETAHTPHRIL